MSCSSNKIQLNGRNNRFWWLIENSVGFQKINFHSVLVPFEFHMHLQGNIFEYLRFYRHYLQKFLSKTTTKIKKNKVEIIINKFLIKRTAMISNKT
jgi:hypothetical protein